ncbi:MAG: site-specific integrase [Acidithiobacillus sp.]
MFHTLYHYPRVVARHEEGPFAPERERFLTHCAETGSAPTTLLRLASELLLVAQRIDLGGVRSVPMTEVAVAADRWVRYQRRQHRIRGSRFSRERFMQAATAWLLFLGRLQPAYEKPWVYDGLINEFGRTMREERGLSQRTIQSRVWYVRAFLRWLDEEAIDLAALRLEQIDAFLALKSQQGWCRVSMAAMVGALRTFLRYAAEHGCCTARIAEGIEGPRLFRDEALPVGPPWSEVQRLIASTDANGPQDRRDRAILLLLAVYGLRSGEVVALTLEDVNWEQGLLHVRRPKQRREQDYPLTATVGGAILDYLQQARPRCALRSLFLAATAPFRPLSASRLHSLVHTRMAALNVRCPHPGPHALRHACATHLVAEGLSLKEIGDHLGHRSAYATRTYAKVDLVGLRQVADVELGDLL